MQLQTLVLSTLAALAVAQTPTTLSSTSSRPTGTGTSPAPTASSTGGLVALVQDLPKCGVKCLGDAAKAANCDASDLACLCRNSSALTSNLQLGACVLNNCNSDEQKKLFAEAPQVCNEINNNPKASDVSSASSIVSAALATGASSTTRSSALAPRRTDAPALALVGGAAAAFAVYVL